jgi:hypothetical protein
VGEQEGIGGEEGSMSGTDEVEDIRLPGRVPRSGTRPRSSGPDVDALDAEPEPDEIQAVNRLLGFLRNTDEP